MMFCTFISLLCITFVVDIHGTSFKPSTSIDQQSIELAELIIKTWSFRPALLRRTKPEVFCPIINECCDDEDRSEAISLIGRYSYTFVRYRLNEIMENCQNSTRKSSCSSSHQLILSQRTAYENSDVKQYIEIIDKYEKDLLKMFFQLLSTCSGPQLHALICSTNKKLIETCSGKMIHHIYNHNDYKNSQEIVMKLKQVFIDINHKLSAKFIKTPNIK